MSDLVRQITQANEERVSALKRKLWAAVDQLEDADGFVLVATAGDVTFTRLKAAGWDEHVLELEPLDIADAQCEYRNVRKYQEDAAKRVRELDAEIAVKEARLADIDAALANALGKGAS